MKVFLGIDPGASGGLVAIEVSPSHVYAGAIETSRIPDTERDTWDWINSYRPLPGERIVVAVIELVGGFIRTEAPNPGSAMFKFGTSYGGLRMALIAADIPFHAVAPAAWQRGLDIPPRKKSEGKTAWKNRLKARAQELFPSASVTLATCDALLIAEYCRRTYG